MIEVNRLISMARDFSNTEICVKSIHPDKLEFSAWSDASFANASQMKSQGGYTVCGTEERLRNGEWADLSPLRWRSYKQDRQVASTLGAELMTLSRTISEAKWVRSLWAEAKFFQYKLEEDQLWSSRIPLTISVDSRPVFDHLNGQMMTIKRLPTDHMLVDGLTKLGVKMDLLRKVLQVGAMRLTEDQTLLRWIGKAPKKT